MAKKSEKAEFERRVSERIAQVAETMGVALTDLSGKLHEELAASIPELRGDPLMVELLGASTESNVETFLHMVRYGIAIDEVNPPSAAVEYARRLAQRGTSSIALVRAYRLGQRRVIDWGFEEIARQEPDPLVAYQAAKTLHETAFTYVDSVSERVVAEYESERERWLANRNTVRSAMLQSLLAGEDVDLAAAEAALGYRLRQNHLGVVLWAGETESSPQQLRQLEQVLAGVGDAVGATGQPLFVAQDASSVWGWLPLGRQIGEIDLDALDRVVSAASPGLRIALGNPAAAATGFCTSHREATRAHAVATTAADRAERVTTYADSGVRAVALLAGDLPTTRELVLSTLGPLAADDENAARLRETLLTFLAEKGSYLATAERVHLHKNTVKYRVDKAIEMRGKALDDDRFNLELALLACRWLGRVVLI